MSWMLVSAAVSVGSGLLSAGKANAAAQAERKRGLEMEAAQWGQNISTNKAIAEANLQNTIRTGFKVGMLNVQRAQAKKRALQQGFDLSKSVAQATGAATANAAAAGVIGSSVDAVVGDIEQKASDARAQMGEDYAAQSDNFDLQLHDLIVSGQDVLKSAESATVQRTAEAQTTSAFEVVAGVAASAIGSYASKKISLGMQNKP